MGKANCNKEKEMSKNKLLVSADMVKDRTGIHTNIDEKLLFPTIKFCQDMFIHPILGSALFNKIITDVPNVTGDYKTLLDDYIIDPLAWYILSESVTDISYQMWNKGVVRKSGDNSENPSPDELQMIRDKYRVRAEWYGERLRTYLIATSTASVLPEYFNGNTELDDINPQGNSFTMPIYLGDTVECLHLDKYNCRCNG